MFTARIVFPTPPRWLTIAKMIGLAISTLIFLLIGIVYSSRSLSAHLARRSGIFVFGRLQLAFENATRKLTRLHLPSGVFKSNVKTWTERDFQAKIGGLRRLNSTIASRKVNMTISLAFLAPDLVKAAIDGRLPHGLGVTRLSELPAEWSRQRQTLGIVAQ